MTRVFCLAARAVAIAGTLATSFISLELKSCLIALVFILAERAVNIVPLVKSLLDPSTGLISSKDAEIVDPV